MLRQLPDAFKQLQIRHLRGAVLVACRHAVEGAYRLALVLVAGILAACASSPVVPYNTPPSLDPGELIADEIGEPAENELVLVINSNIKMVHAGMFAGSRLFDPAGSYENSRRGESDWQGPNLVDYLRFQLEDGPDVKMYRFLLQPEALGDVLRRIEAAGVTFPLFCANTVQTVISGVGPFASMQDTWLMHPASLAVELDQLIVSGVPGKCLWPDGSSCYQPTTTSPVEIARKHAQ